MNRLAAALLCLALVFTLSAFPKAVVAGETVILPSDSIPGVEQQSAIAQARDLIAAGDFDTAVRELADFVRSHPDATDAARFLGDLYYRQGNFKQAEAVYQALLARNAHDKETHNRLGVVYATENHVDAAIAEFEAALPGTDSIRDLVMLHLRKGDLPAYEAEMLRAANDQPSDSDVQEELGEVYEAAHRPLDAIEYFQRALDSDPTSIAALNGAAMAYLDIHNPTTATHYLSRCLNLDPQNYACLDNLGVAKIQAGNFADARKDLDRAHHLEPERPEAIVNFGYLADYNGDWKRAVAYYVQAVAVDPYVPESYVNLGIDYEHNGLYALAQGALLKGVASVPYDGRIRYLLARAYIAQGQRALALDQLKAAEESLDPDVAQIAKEESARLTSAAPDTAPNE